MTTPKDDKVSAPPCGTDGSAARPTAFDAALALENISDAFFALDCRWRFTYLNPQAERLLARPRAELLGRNFWAEFPAAVGTVSEREYRRAMEQQVVASFDQFYPPLGAWFEARAHPSPDGISVYFRDITERVEREKRERFLADLAERARGLTDPDAVIADALRSVGEFLGVSRCVFVDVDLVADTCICHPDYRADESVASMEGVSPISAYGPYLAAQYGAGHAVAVDDVRLDRAQVPAENVAAYDALGIRAHVGVPVVHSARLVSCLGAHSPVPRRWTTEEVELLRTVVERTWLTVEVLRQQRAARREAEERRQAHERTAVILESVADAFYAVDADFRFTYVNRRAEALWGRSREQLLGRPFLDVFPQAADSAPFGRHRRVMAEREPAHYETVSPIIGTWVEVSIYPTADGGLSIFFRDIEGRKAVEAERERLAERERNIAQQLQNALTPVIPEHVPGLALKKFYKAALEEAGVGGDFYDVFPVADGCTALVVGDLSGKGLEAAAQVATVRNMLRAFAYTRATPAGAVTELNRVIAEKDLLSGFATVFAGVYDAETGTLTYVNCGQEPALLRRADTGAVELLAPTGPVLGSFGGAVFAQDTVRLASGDTLAVFTDGFTEVGSRRRDMIGIEGVAAIMAGAISPAEDGSAEAVAEKLALRLIEGVESAAQGGVVRDDVCLLIAVAH